MGEDDLPPPQSYDYRNVVCVETVSRQQIQGRQKQAYFDALDWTAKEFVDPGIAMAISHDAGLDDVKICMLALLWCFYPTSLLCLPIKNLLASLPGLLLGPRNNCVPRGQDQDLARVSQCLGVEIAVGVPVTSAVLILPQWVAE